MDIAQQIEWLSEVLVELVERDRNDVHIKGFMQNCGNADLQREWNSLTEKEQRAVADELYYLKKKQKK
mgnify:FL=1